MTFNHCSKRHFGAFNWFSISPACWAGVFHLLVCTTKMPRRGWHVSEDPSRAVWQEILRGPRPPAAKWPPAQGSRQRQRFEGFRESIQDRRDSIRGRGSVQGRLGSAEGRRGSVHGSTGGRRSSVGAHPIQRKQFRTPEPGWSSWKRHQLLFGRGGGSATQG